MATDTCWLPAKRDVLKSCGSSLHEAFVFQARRAEVQQQAEPGIVVGKDCNGRQPCIAEATGPVLDCATRAQPQGGDFARGALAAAFAAFDNVPGLDTVTTLVLSVGAAFCAGDCDQNGTGTVDELITLVSIALGKHHPHRARRAFPAERRSTSP